MQAPECHGETVKVKSFACICRGCEGGQVQIPECLGETVKVKSFACICYLPVRAIDIGAQGKVEYAETHAFKKGLQFRMPRWHGTAKEQASDWLGLGLWLWCRVI